MLLTNHLIMRKLRLDRSCLIGFVGLDSLSCREIGASGLPDPSFRDPPVDPINTSEHIQRVFKDTRKTPKDRDLRPET